MAFVTSRERPPDDGPDLSPPGEGFELYRHRAFARLRTKNWHGYYWARPDREGDYEIRTLPTSLGEPSVPGGTFPRLAFERLYEKVEELPASVPDPR